jgi:ATP-dependent Clp protease ATP-binding subunit ClpA
MGELGLTPRAKRAIELAVNEARRLNHHYIGTEHLLLGLVREGENIASGVLESLGVSLDQARTGVLKVLGSSDYVPEDTDEVSSQGLPTEPPSWLREARTRSFGSVRAVRSERWVASIGPRPNGEDRSALEAWKNAELNFHLLSKVDDSFLHTLREAMSIAVLLAHNYLGTDHLLAAMLRDKNSAASRLLGEAGADLDTVNDTLNAGIATMWADGPFTYEALGAIRLAIDAAASADQLPATSDHLLLGIILEGHNTGAAAMLEAGVTAERVRALILEDRSSSDD